MKKFVNYKYVLEELVDSMEQAINNASGIIRKTNKLIKLIQENDKNNEFEDFVKMFNEQSKHYEQQVKIMKHRVDLVKTMLPDLSEKEKLYLTSTLLEVLGVANKDAKSLEEREKNKEEVIIC